jgi:cytochrome c biogenesis factor
LKIGIGKRVIWNWDPVKEAELLWWLEKEG